ncbi:MAG: chemotaxis protein [Lachnospiraceae bacterium]|nr:chemotaxis protein [Lachnospiraceae bacterium]
MPKGNPNTQTRATDKYQKKVGLMSKSYKLKKSLVDEFAKTCEKNGISQAKQLSILMSEYVKNN